MLGQCWATCWPMLGHVWPICCVICWAMLGHMFGQSWVTCWATLAHGWAMLGYLLGHVGACLAEVGLFDRPCWAICLGERFGYLLGHRPQAKKPKAPLPVGSACSIRIRVSIFRGGAMKDHCQDSPGTTYVPWECIDRIDASCRRSRREDPQGRYTGKDAILF